MIFLKKVRDKIFREIFKKRTLCRRVSAFSNLAPDRRGAQRLVHWNARQKLSAMKQLSSPKFFWAARKTRRHVSASPEFRPEPQPAISVTLLQPCCFDRWEEGATDPPCDTIAQCPDRQHRLQHRLHRLHLIRQLRHPQERHRARSAGLRGKGLLLLGLRTHRRQRRGHVRHRASPHSRPPHASRMGKRRRSV